LQQAAKNAASAATQVINLSDGVYRQNAADPTRQQLAQHCHVVGDDMIPRVVRALRATIKTNNSPASQVQLLTTAQDFLQPSSKMLLSVKAVVPTVSDQHQSIGLTNAARTLTTALADLRAAAASVQQTVRASDIDLAVEQLQAMETELKEIGQAARRGELKTLPGEAECGAQLGATTRAVSAVMAQLLTAAIQGDEEAINSAVRNASNALRGLTDSVRAVVATSSEDPGTQTALTEHALDVLDKSGKLLDEIRRAMNNTDNPDNRMRLAQVAKAVPGVDWLCELSAGST